MIQKPYTSMMDQICRSNGWVLGSDKGEMVIGVNTADGAQQPVVINDFQDGSTAQFAIRLWSPVCPADRLPADQALQLNMQLPHGCLANREGQIVMTATRVLNMTNQTDLTNLLSVIAYYASFYAKHYAGS